MRFPGKKNLIGPQIHKGFSTKCPFQSAESWMSFWIGSFWRVAGASCIGFVTYITSKLGKCGPEISPLQLTIYDWFPSKHLFYFVMQGIGNTVQLCKGMCLS